MIVEPFRRDDIEHFLALAAEEHWISETWEFEFLLSTFSQGCFAARGDEGEKAGFVTSIRYERSGWIGNLIVAKQYRNKGIGEALFRKVLEALKLEGAQTIWLTASKSGAPLYEKHGFTGIDEINRWIGTGCNTNTLHRETIGYDIRLSSLYDFDRWSWGDRRAKLIDTIVHRGKLLQNESGFIVIQPCGDAVQLGPFSSLDDKTAADLFKLAFETVFAGKKVFVDAPASNRSAALLYGQRNLRIAGNNLLMYAGEKPDYRPELLFGLATMGSCG